MTEKRSDLQGLRGVAILLILMFHLRPGLFTLGFIGVDMFFVLSGYLITMILANKPITTVVVLEFYKKRFKRIVPLFASILTMVYLISWRYLLSVDRLQLLTDLKWSLTFTSNIQPLSESKGYWDQITSHRFLVHCWSLGVEIQFYAIAPFVVGCRQRQWYFIIKQYTSFHHIRHYIIYILFFFSLCFQLLAPPKITYGLLPSRIWQFLAGTTAYEIEMFTASSNMNVSMIAEPRITSKLTEPANNVWVLLFREFILIFLTLLVIVSPNYLDETKMRLLGTSSTAIYICLNSFASYSLLSLKPLVYVGDISYTLYLVHWPVIVFYKYYYSLEQLDLAGICWCLCVMFICSISIHYSIEEFLVHSTITQGILVFSVSLLFISLTSTVYKNDGQKDISESEVIRKAIEYNNEMDVRQGIETDLENPNRTYTWQPCKRDFEAEKWTGWTEEPQMRCVTRGTGTLKVLVVGNSIAYRAFPRIHQIFNGRYNTLRLFTRSILPGIYASSKNPTSRMFEKAIRKLVESMKPDVVFIIFTSLVNDHEGHEMQAPVKDFSTDMVLRRMQRNIDHYSKYSRKIVIEMPYYTRWYTVFLWEVNKRLKLGTSLEDLKITRKDLEKQHHWQHARLQHLNCSKCILNDINEVLFANDTFYFYDRKTFHVYYQDGIHLTYAGLDLLMNNYRTVINRLINELNYFF